MSSHVSSHDVLTIYHNLLSNTSEFKLFVLCCCCKYYRYCCCCLFMLLLSFCVIFVVGRAMCLVPHVPPAELRVHPSSYNVLPKLNCSLFICCCVLCPPGPPWPWGVLPMAAGARAPHGHGYPWQRGGTTPFGVTSGRSKDVNVFAGSDWAYW